MLALEGVREGDVDLGAVERAVAGVQLPLEAEAVQRLGKVLLGLVPHLDVAQELLGPGKSCEIF